MPTAYAILGAVLGGILAVRTGLYRIAEQADLPTGEPQTKF